MVLKDIQEPRGLPSPRLRVAALVVRDGQVLLVQQARHQRRYWLLPGGGVHRGETLVECLRRELLEEIGANIDVLGPPLGMVESISPDEGTTRHTVHVVFAAASLSPPGDFLPCDPAIREILWASAADLPSLEIHPPMGDLIAAWIPVFAEGIPSTWPPFVHAGRRWLP